MAVKNRIHKNQGKNNPFAICTAALGPEKTAKRERCIKKLKRRFGVR